jgi:hypothetical protein
MISDCRLHEQGVSHARHRGRWVPLGGLLLVFALVTALLAPVAPAGANSPTSAALTWTEKTPVTSPPALDNPTMANDPATG